MKNYDIRITSFLIGLILILTLLPQSAAAVVWSDDFNDGNLDGWTIADGNFIAYEHSSGDYALCVDPSSASYGYAWCSSNDTVGQWSFDYYAPSGDINSFVDFWFIYNGTGLLDPKGYCVSVDRDADVPSLRLIRFDGSFVGGALIGLWVFPEIISATWTHFDITRDGATGEMNVWMNGTWIMDATDTEFNHSEKFVWMNFKGGVIGDRIFQDIMLDNVVADDEILLYHDDGTTTTTEPTTPTEPTTTDPGDGEPFVLDPMLLAIGGGAVALIIIIVIVLKRK